MMLSRARRACSCFAAGSAGKFIPLQVINGANVTLAENLTQRRRAAGILSEPIVRAYALVCTPLLSQIKEGASATLTENLVQSNGGAGVLIHADCGGSMVRNDVKDNTGGQVISHAPERRFVIG